MVLRPISSISLLHVTVDISYLLDTVWIILHCNTNDGSDLMFASLMGPSLFWKVHGINSLIFQALFSPTASTGFTSSTVGQPGGTSLIVSPLANVWLSITDSLVGRKRHLELVGSDVCPLQSPISSPIQSRRLSFTTGLHPLVVEQREFPLEQLESRPFDCLVHLACSLLHP